jgi:hypothetical protein
MVLGMIINVHTCYLHVLLILPAAEYAKNSLLSNGILSMESGYLRELLETSSFTDLTDYSKWSHR